MKISVIGTGLLGTAMAERLLVLGHDVVVWNRTREKTDHLRRQGATVARSAGEAVRANDCKILILSDAHAIQNVLWASQELPNFQKRTIIQMGTISPEESITIGKEIRSKLGEYMEAPVLGSLAETRAGKLVIMVGGTAELLERWIPVMKCFSVAPILVGPIGQASALKLALNQLIASHITAFSLSLGLIHESGVNVEIFMQVLRQSALMAPMYDKKLPKLLSHDYANPNFSTEHLLKDVTLCLQTAKSAHLETSTLEGIQNILPKSVIQGLPNQDYSSVFETIVPNKR